MDFDAYEKQHAALYAEFAGTIELILEKAIAGTEGIPRPQSIQCRAKSLASLKRKLEDRSLLESDSIETEIRDLAGARLIFYTNTGVDRFLNSRLIPENFQIDRDATRVHHPTKENEGQRYQAIHYTVSLNDDRAKLPEYAKFKGMRCEIQIQTILNHAWSETSHDILYKDKPRQGFGSKAMESISNRFSQIMDKYLLPAGFEFQRVQHDYERLQQGKELFDRDAIQSLEAAKNNNERHDLLSSLKEYALPNYDDIPAIYGDLRGPLVDAAKASRSAPVEPIKTTFGDLEGRTAADVTNIIVDIFDTFRYADIERTFSALCEIYRDEPDPGVRKNILDAVKRLAHYDLDVWRQVGPGVQVALAGFIERMQEGDRSALRPLLITVWSEVLDSGITGTTWKADSIQLRSGALPVSDELRAVREKAMTGLFDLFAQSTTEAQKRQVLSALREAAHLARGRHAGASGRSLVAALSATILMVSIPRIALAQIESGDESVGSRAVDARDLLPESFLGWKKHSGETAWKPAPRTPIPYALGAYARGNQEITIFVAAAERQKDKVFGFAIDLMGPGPWFEANRPHLANCLLPICGAVHAIEFDRQSSEDVRHVYYVYAMGDRIIGSTLQLQLQRAWNTLVGAPRQARILAVASDGGTELPTMDIVEVLKTLVRS